MNGNVVVLAGGTGGAKFVRGVACCVPPERLTVIANTADDVTMHGLRISPDVDIITYTLAGLVDPMKAWGFAGDTFACLEQLRGYGRAGWFNLGDRDLATHIHRTNLLAQGKPPSQVADHIRRALGVRQQILPMTDQAVETHVQLGDGSLVHFQEYLIERGAPEDVQAVIFQNISAALPANGVLRAIEEADVVLLAPSSPVVSIGAILSVNGIYDAIVTSEARAAAVSPLLGDAPISGPSGQLMRAFGIEVNNGGLVTAYGDLITLLVIHERDAAEIPALESSGLGVLAIDTLMPDLAGSKRVARAVLEALDYPVVDVFVPEPPPSEAPASGPGAPAAPVDTAPPRAELDALRTHVTELETQLAAAEDAAVAWAELDAAHNMVEDLRTALEQAHEEAARAKDEVDVAWAEHDRIQATLEAEQRRAETSEAASHEAANRDAEWTAQVEDLETRLRQTQAEAERGARDAERLHAEALAEARRHEEATVRARAAAETEVERLTRRIADIEEERCRLQDRVEETELLLAHERDARAAESADAVEARAALEAGVASLFEELRQARLERERAVTVCARAQRDAEAARGAMAVATEEWGEAFRGMEWQREERLAALEHETAVLAATRDEVRAQSLTVEEQLAHERETWRDREEQRDELVRRLQQEMVELDASRDAADRTARELQDRFDRERAARETLAARVRELEATLQQAVAYRQRAREKRHEQRERARAVIEKLRAQLQVARQAALDARQRRDAVSAPSADGAPAPDDLRAPPEQLRERVVVLEAELNAAHAALAASEARVVQLQAHGPKDAVEDSPSAEPPPPTDTEAEMQPGEENEAEAEATAAGSNKTADPGGRDTGRVHLSNTPLSLESLGWRAEEGPETLAERARRRGRHRF